MNCGSSSIKYQVIDMEAASSKVLAKGIVERIGLAEGDLVHKPVGGSSELRQPIPDHTTGIRLVLDALTDPAHGVIRSLDEVKAVGHRVAHLGSEFPKAAWSPRRSRRRSARCSRSPRCRTPPTSRARALDREGVAGRCRRSRSSTRRSTRPSRLSIGTYALPHAYYDKYRVRKYPVSARAPLRIPRGRRTGRAGLSPLENHHLPHRQRRVGDGRARRQVLRYVDGPPPLDGLVMGTRRRQVTPAPSPTSAKSEAFHAELNDMMNKRLACWGSRTSSSDMRDIDRAYDEGDPRAILARDMHYGRIKKFVGQYAAEMGGVDLIVFTGGVGENSEEMRESVCLGLEFMGVKFDPAANNAARGVTSCARRPIA